MEDSNKCCTFAPLLNKATLIGAVVQLVRISACHAGGRGFESRPHRRSLEKSRLLFFVITITSYPVVSIYAYKMLPLHSFIS